MENHDSSEREQFIHEAEKVLEDLKKTEEEMKEFVKREHGTPTQGDADGSGTVGS